MAELQMAAEELLGDLKRNWGWMLALGIVMVVLGVIGLGMTFWLSVVSVIYLGVLLLIGCGAQAVQVFRAAGWKGRLWHLLVAGVYLVAGIVCITNPVASGLSLTLFIAWALIAIGVLRLLMAFRLRGSGAWGWLLAGGVLSLLLGILILMQWPASGLWVIGLFVAIELIVAGWTQIMLALAAKRFDPGSVAHPAA